MKKLLLGVGNTLRQDDGIGIKLLEFLKQQTLPQDIEIADGGTDGLGLVNIIQEYDKVLIIDAVNMGETPGIIKVFSPDDIVAKMATDSLSTHGFGLAEVLSLGKQLGLPTEIRVVGIQPQSVGFGEELTESIKSKIPEYIKIIGDELVGAFFTE